MAKLPSVISRKVVKAFQSFGWEVVRRESSHIIMVREGEIATLPCPTTIPSPRERSAGLFPPRV